MNSSESITRISYKGIVILDIKGYVEAVVSSPSLPVATTSAHKRILLWIEMLFLQNGVEIAGKTLRGNKIEELVQLVEIEIAVCDFMLETSADQSDFAGVQAQVYRSFHKLMHNMFWNKHKLRNRLLPAYFAEQIRT
jgi:hypothetical protein